MSLQYESMTMVPDETARVAQAVFPKGTLAMQVRDVLYGIYTHDDFADLFPARGQPALAAWRLALVTILQFIEGLPHRQAADAVRDRIAWKYALGLELTDQGFDFSVLSEFRDRLLAGAAEYRLLKRMLERLRDRGLLKARGRQRTDSTHVLAAIRTLNRLTCVGETLRAALNAIATVAAQWLRLQITLDWFDLYSRRMEDFRLPQRDTESQALAATIGAHGVQLLTAIYSPTAPTGVCDLPAVEVLRQVWIQQYYAPDADGMLRWRIRADLPPGAQLIVSPYDVEAHPGNKRSTIWTGYKVHLSETCEEELPNLITHVETTNAAQLDASALDSIHEQLAAKHLLPQTHSVDAGYVDSEHLLSSQRDHQVTLLGPVPDDPSWQAHAGKGFDVACFAVDWEAQRLTCPAGAQSRDWKMGTDRHGKEVIHVQFDRRVCALCAQRSDCTRASTTGRELTLRPREQHIALQAARQRQTTADFKAAYVVRAGVEGSLSQGVRIGGLRQARYRGLPKTRLQHILTAVGINIIRVLAWLAEPARAIIQPSRFAALAPTNSVQTLVGAT